VKQAKTAGARLPQEGHEVELNTILTGKVFFNHFVANDTKLRPSILLKAWNRGAAIMTKARTKGIDFVIPVVVKVDNLKETVKNFGPLFGEWTGDEEKAADAVMAYILIQPNTV
jgi:hypothetical protein